MSTQTRTQPGEEPAADAAEPDAPAGEVFRRIYAFFYNKRTGLVLIIAMAVLTLLGVLFAQAPPGARATPEAYASWLEGMRPRYRGWTDILSALGVFRMFQSIPFLAVAGLLAVSILACTAHRVPLLHKQAARPHTHVRDSFFDHGALRAAVAVAAPPEEARDRVRAALRSQRFRVLEEPRGPGLNLYADRNRWAPFGTAIAHIAMVVILLGAVLTASTGFANDSFTVSTGAIVEVGEGTGLSVELVSFTDEYQADGTPKDYASHLIVHKDGVPVAEQVVRVNTPLRVDGISFNQAFFGNAVDLTVAGADGTVLHEGGVPQRLTTEDGLYNYGILTLQDAGLELFVISPASGQAERSLQAGEVGLEIYGLEDEAALAKEVLTQGTPVVAAGLTVTFERENRYTGLRVSKDPGKGWIWAGAILLILGTCWTMFFRFRRLWVRVEEADGGARVRIASPDRPDPAVEATLAALTRALTPEEPRRTEQQNGAPTGAADNRKAAGNE